MMMMGVTVLSSAYGANGHWAIGTGRHPEEVPPSERRATAKRPNPEPRHATCRTDQTRKGTRTAHDGARRLAAPRPASTHAACKHTTLPGPTRNRKSATGGLTVIATTAHRTHRRRWWREQEGEERASTGGVQAAVPRPFHPVPAPNGRYQRPTAFYNAATRRSCWRTLPKPRPLLPLLRPHPA
jgi:hypothetical protein